MYPAQLSSLVCLQRVVIALAVLCAGGVTGVRTVAHSQQASGPVLTFEVTTIDYGNVARGSDPLRRFKFTNTGNEPLIIKTAKGSCPCMTVILHRNPSCPAKVRCLKSVTTPNALAHSRRSSP